MKASHWLTATVNNGVAVIEAAANLGFSLLGTTCKTSVEPDFFREIPMLSVAPTAGKDALIAITVKATGRGSEADGAFLIPLCWQGEKVIVDLDGPFFSPVKRIGQVLAYRQRPTLQVQGSNGQMFVCTRLPDGLSPSALTPKDHRRVENPNILLRYLMAEVQDEELELAASKDERSLEQREIAALKREVEAKSKVLLTVRSEYKKAKVRIEELENWVRHDNLQLKNLFKNVALIRHALNNSKSQHTALGFLAKQKVAKIKKILSDPDLS